MASKGGLVSGDSGAADIFLAATDVGEPGDKLETASHVTIAEHHARAHPRPGETDAELLREEGADLPHATKAGHVELPGAQE